MITANLYHIKRTNGLFYYALDYLRETSDIVRVILARAELVPALRISIPRVHVMPVSLRATLSYVRKAHAQGDFIFTPTPHPYPFLSRQLVVFHDPYPFLSFPGGIKRLLLRASFSVSSCHVAYINRSEGRPFLTQLGLKDERMLFAPNLPPRLPRLDSCQKEPGLPYRVGLVGTDSPKKNYEALLDSILRKINPSHIAFHVLGHRTSYFESLEKKFPMFTFFLMDSESAGLHGFLADIDLLVSVAKHEGFGRPIAGAMVMGVPCLLLRQAVFEEFFSEGALFASDIDDLTIRLARLCTGELRLDGAPPTQSNELARDFNVAVGFLREHAGNA